MQAILSSIWWRHHEARRILQKPQFRNIVTTPETQAVRQIQYK